MPVRFVSADSPSVGVVISSDENNLIRYLSNLVRDTVHGEPDNLQVSITISVQLEGRRSASPSTITLTNDPGDPDATIVRLSEDAMLDRYP